MRADIKQKWIEALRSGDYEQAQGRLHFVDAHGKDSFCCLGVLCQIAMSEGIELEQTTFETDEGSAVLYDTQESFLPTNVVNWSGIDAQGSISFTNDEVDLPPDEETLANLNDSGVTFDHLATIIEETL